MLRREMAIILSVLLIAAVLTACGAAPSGPSWGPRVTLQSAEPLSAEELAVTLTAAAASPTPRTPVDAASVQVGRWTWTRFTTPAETYPPVQMWLDVAEGGEVSGLLSIYPSGAEVPEAARTPIQLNGCNVEIESLDMGGVLGAFYDVTEAVVYVDVSACNVKFFGPVTLTEPLQGELVLQYNDAVTQALLNPEEVVLTPIEEGRQVFALYCSGCHGSYAEGISSTPGLNTDDVQKKSDDELLATIANGVINTDMPAWGAVLTEAQMAGVMELIRNLDVLESDN